MNTTVKAILTAAALSTASVCLSVSMPVAAQSESSDLNLIVVNKYYAINASDKDLLPSSELFNTETFAQIFDKPLVKIPLNDIPSYEMNKTEKNSIFFAVSTLLNDKLQQLIAKFTQSSPSYSLNKDGEMELNELAFKSCNVKRS